MRRVRESEEWMSLSIVAFYVVGSSSFYIDINHGWCAKFCWRYHRSQCGSFNVIQFDLISECICAFMRYQLAQNEKEKQHRRSSALFRLFIACVCVCLMPESIFIHIVNIAMDILYHSKPMWIVSIEMRNTTRAMRYEEKNPKRYKAHNNIIKINLF